MTKTLAEQTLATPLFTLNGRTYPAKCVKCYDADSIHVVVLLHGAYTRFRCRLKGIDTAELRSKDNDEKAHAVQARDYLKTLIMDKLIVINCYEFDKYGRLLVDVFVDRDVLNALNPALVHGGDTTEQQHPLHYGGGDQVHINHHLIQCGYAYEYRGGRRLTFAEWRPHWRGSL